MIQKWDKDIEYDHEKIVKEEKERWYNLYFTVTDHSDPLAPLSVARHNETMGIRAASKEEALHKFWAEIPDHSEPDYRITSVEEGPLAEDINKYATEEEKEFLGEGVWEDRLKPKCTRCHGTGYLAGRHPVSKLNDVMIRCPRCKGSGLAPKK